MAQQVVRAMVNFKMKNLQVRKPTMDFIFEQRGSNTNVTPSSIYTQLHTFFNTVPSGGAKNMAKYMSNAVLWSDAAVMHTRLYDITGKLSGLVPAGSPIDEDFYSPTNRPTGAEQGLPLEVSAVLSYRSDYGTDPEFGLPTGHEKGRFRPRATHRGRVYLGPLNITCIADDTNQEAIFTAAFVTDMKAALSALVAGPGGTTDVSQMVQWSRSQQRVSPITKIDVNNEPDIRRRRGLKAPTHTWA